MKREMKREMNSTLCIWPKINQGFNNAAGVTNTGNGERGTGNRERESGNECTAVILLRIQNGGRKHGNRVNM